MNEKFDKLDALILLAGDVLIEEELAYAREVLDPELVISKRTDRRILNYIRHTQKKRTYHPVLEAMKRIAVVVLVIGTVLFASAMSIEAVREKFWNAIVEWYEDYIAVMFVDDTAGDTMMDVEFEVREPSYLPEGVVKGEQVTKHSSCHTGYFYKNKKILSLEQLIIPHEKIEVDNTNCILSEIYINKYHAILAEYIAPQKCYVIVWEDEYYRYNLITEPFSTPSITVEELLEIASSIY